MFKEFLSSLRFPWLRRHLQKLRLQFFMAIEGFDDAMQSEDLDYTAGAYLDEISFYFPKIMDTILMIESLEKDLGRGDIFNADGYIFILFKDMFSSMIRVKHNLEVKLEGMKLIKADLGNLEDQETGYRGNVDLMEIHAEPLIEELIHAITRISNIIEELEKNYKKYRLGPDLFRG